MAQPQDALAPIFPVKGDVEIDTPLAAGKAHLFFDPPLGGFHAGMRDDAATFQLLDPRLAPFQIGHLRFAGRLEHAIAGIPIRLKSYFLECAVRNPADNGVIAGDRKSTRLHYSHEWMSRE